MGESKHPHTLKAAAFRWRYPLQRGWKLCATDPGDDCISEPLYTAHDARVIAELVDALKASRRALTFQLASSENVKLLNQANSEAVVALDTIRATLAKIGGA
jgi:hypothetical protein